MWVLKVKVISLPYIFQVLYVLFFTRSRYQVSVYRTNGPLVFKPLLQFTLIAQEQLSGYCQFINMSRSYLHSNIIFYSNTPRLYS